MNILDNYDPADILPSIANALVITLTVVVMINFLKFAMVKFPIPGLAPLIWNT